ncbi:TEX13C [Symbiodinium sp. CCMP2592]|nr:TEX13C [Symbiodinium sp. CCMP2592]
MDDEHECADDDDEILKELESQVFGEGDDADAGGAPPTPPPANPPPDTTPPPAPAPTPSTTATAGDTRVQELEAQLGAVQQMLQMLLAQNGSTSASLNPETVHTLLRRPATTDIETHTARPKASVAAPKAPPILGVRSVPPASRVTFAQPKAVPDAPAATVPDASAPNATPLAPAATVPDSSAPNPKATPVTPAATVPDASPPTPKATPLTRAATVPDSSAPNPKATPVAPASTAPDASTPNPKATPVAPASPVPGSSAPNPKATPVAPASTVPDASTPNPKATPVAPAPPVPGSSAPNPKATPVAPAAPVPGSSAPNPKATPVAPAAAAPNAEEEEEEETPEERAAREEKERLKREAHADWMRYNRSQRHVLRHLFEVFVSAGENWLESSIVLNARRKNANRRRGKFIWITFEEWQLLRVFDGKIETEEEDSETEHIFEMGGNISGTANFASALIKDVEPSIAAMKDAVNALQAHIGKVTPDQLAVYNNSAEQALKAYEEAVGTIKRTIAINKPKTTKPSKKHAKAKSAS